jgi:hypothetical protein
VQQELQEQKIQELQEMVELAEMGVVEHHLLTLEDTMAQVVVLEEILEHIILDLPLLMVDMVEPVLQQVVEMEDLVIREPREIQTPTDTLTQTITDRVVAVEEQM